MIYAYSQTELKTLLFPSIPFIEKFYGKGTYSKICEFANLKLRYNYYQQLDKSNKIKEIICDTRETRLLKFNGNIKIQKIDCGDYAPNPNLQKIFIERKSLQDFLGVTNIGYDRFTRELERVKKNNYYLIILIEEKFQNLSSFRFLPHIHSKASQLFVFHQCHEICQNFAENVQILCCDGRKDAARIIELIFSIKNDIKKIDLMYEYDVGHLN